MNLNDFEILKENLPAHCIWIKILVKIKNNQTGEVKNYPTEGIWDEVNEHASTWIWEEGNFSCDCNRDIFFNGLPFSDDHECGEGKYSVNIYNPKNGELLYSEFP